MPLSDNQVHIRTHTHTHINPHFKLFRYHNHLNQHQQTIKLLWVTDVVLGPVRPIADQVEVPARCQKCLVALFCYHHHFILPPILPHFNHCVCSKLVTQTHTHFCQCAKDQSQTIEFLWVTLVVLWPVRSIADVVEVPARRQECLVALLCHLGHFILPPILPHLHHCVCSHLVFSQIKLICILNQNPQQVFCFCQMLGILHSKIWPWHHLKEVCGKESHCIITIA